MCYLLYLADHLYKCCSLCSMFVVICILVVYLIDCSGLALQCVHWYLLHQGSTHQAERICALSAGAFRCNHAIITKYLPVVSSSKYRYYDTAKAFVPTLPMMVVHRYRHSLRAT